MGNNAAFTAFEDVILATYRHQVLTRPLLLDIAKAFEDQDADSGGYQGLLVHGKDMYEIVIEVSGGKVPVKPVLPRDYKDWSTQDELESENYQEAISDAFSTWLPGW